MTIQEGPWSVLLWGAAAGRVAVIFSSPPSRSWGTLAPSSCGSEDRTLDDPWSADCVSERTVRENLMLIQDMFLWSVASVARGGGIPFLKEFPHPDDGQSAASPNFWVTATWTRFQSWAGVKRRYLETGNFSGTVPLQYRHKS